ncbi:MULTISPECIES: hypothetical protein [Gammaproteobacteria]|jgi:hypothetical protein|uniref:Uncharacterized protein n=1 Tax=Xanthomonas boreopolis TaxID=86183 RepID=A0A919F865_9XANT|nr:hypothetical protein [Pseudomonas sp. Hp2]GHH54294.1 hypothetical protein GCM10009090_20870 [[Pseudomonas] boreopolis]
MNTKSLSAAIAFAAGSVLASMTAHATPITTLDTVQVRPSAEQIAQREHERTSPIPTLAAVQVRPSAEQVAEYEAGLRVVTLAAVEVRPSAEQRAELLASRESGETASNALTAEASAAVAELVGQVIVNLPKPRLLPSPLDLRALVGSFAQY